MFLGPQDEIPQSCMSYVVNIQNREAAWKLSLGCLSWSSLAVKLHPGAGLENAG